MDLTRQGVELDRKARNNENTNQSKIENEFGTFERTLQETVENVSNEAFDKVVDAAKLDWDHMVELYSELPSTAKEGTTIGVVENGIVYRFNGTEWTPIYKINLNPIAEVDSRLTSQLADNVDYVSDISDSIKHGEYDGAVVSFGFDDGHNHDFDKIKPIFESEGVPCNSAIVTSLIGTSGYMSLDRLNELKSLGWGVVSHTHTHTRWDKLTDEQVDFEFKESKRILKENGFDHDILVYPFGATEDRVFNKARKYYKMGVNIIYSYLSNEIGKMDNYNLRRMRGLSQPEGAGTTLAECKASVDEAIANKTYLIFEDHSYYSDWTTLKLEELRQLIQYIKSKGVPIINFSDGYKLKCNVMDVGQHNKNFKVYKNGLTPSSGFEDYSYDANTPITHFAFGESRTFFSTSQISGKGFPTNKGGTVTTVRVSNSIFYGDENLSGVQTFRPYNYTDIYIREWRTSGVWGEWIPLNKKQVEPTLNAYTASNVLEDFPKNDITVFHVNTASATGMPNNLAGVCTVYRVGSQAGYSRQEFRPYRSNEVWSRLVDESTGGWQAWVKISAV